ncbi:MAG: hypothetical protein SGI83_05295 [Bacteroidota bacterium]|nr:hypothetical protein [Bacteroidota bacterium]
MFEFNDPPRSVRNRSLVGTIDARVAPVALLTVWAETGKNIPAENIKKNSFFNRLSLIFNLFMILKLLGCVKYFMSVF